MPTGSFGPGIPEGGGSGLTGSGVGVGTSGLGSGFGVSAMAHPFISSLTEELRLPRHGPARLPSGRAHYTAAHCRRLGGLHDISKKPEGARDELVELMMKSKADMGMPTLTNPARDNSP